MEEINSFTIRVYALIVRSGEILLSDECLGDTYFTKFPGGGLEFGEGARDALKREFKEELNAEILIDSHFYTTDFFVSSSFDASKQVISIYYMAQFKHSADAPNNTKPFNFSRSEYKAESFRWVKLSKLQESHVTFPIDQKVVQLLKANML